MDMASLMGLLLGVAAVVGGNILEGGRPGSMVQMAAAVIVFGGTLGATLLSFPARDIFKAFTALKEIFFYQKPSFSNIIKDILNFSRMARKSGFLVVESDISNIGDYYFRKTLKLAIDGMSPRMLRETMEQENLIYEEEKRRIARVFETAGGFSPTIGILGAVLGLIHVMENLTDPSRLGTGISVAFVATIYGVGSANLIFLPISKKLLNRMRTEINRREMIIEGVIGIQSGLNAYYLGERLAVYAELPDRSGAERI